MKFIARPPRSVYLWFMKDIEIDLFWARVDYLLKLKRKSLTDLCNDCGIGYSAVNSQRTRGSLPKIGQIYAMAQYLGTSIEFLLSGKEPDYKLPEKLQIIVDYLKKHDNVADLILEMAEVKKGDCSATGAS